MSYRIKCVFHAENTASMVISNEYFKCFGCGEKGHISRLKDIKVDLNLAKSHKKHFNLTDFQNKVREIKSLPVNKIRGLELPTDGLGYYILWPDETYYKYRKLDATKQKYLSAPGAKRTLLEMPGSYSKLLIVEGELNAISVYQSRPDFKIVSPGSASDLNAYMDYYEEYDYIYVAFDLDPAGVYNAIKLRDALLARKKFVFLHPMKRDFNDILTKDGLDEVRREVEKISGLQRNLRDSKARQDVQVP